MRPTATRLLVRVIPEAIHVPEPSKKNAIPMPTIKGNTVLRAKVLDVGPGVKGIADGDTVMFSPYGFDEIEMFIDGKPEKLVIIQEDMILAYDNTGKNTGTKG